MTQYLDAPLGDYEFYCLIQELKRNYGDISEYQFRRCEDVINSALRKWARVFAVRIDLRLADTYRGDEPDMPICFQREDSQVITRFFESHKSQYREDHRRKGKRGEPIMPMYIWVREQDGGKHPHYHLFLFFNKDHYAFMGDFSNPGANNVATRIQRAWCSALGLPYPDYRHLVHIPKNPAYSLDRKMVVIHSPSYMALLIRMAYLCKMRTKPVGDGRRNFGCSQTHRYDLG